jgi:peroxiredoxin
MTNGTEKPQQTSPSAMLSAGTAAPDFTLDSTPDNKISLSDYRGRPVVLVFYPADWSPVCGDQLALYNEIVPEFNNFDAQILGISVDSVWSHQAYVSSRNLRFPLLADFHPKGAVGRLYGVYDDEVGEEKRSLFVIDRNGAIAWSFMGATWVNPGAAGILKALHALLNSQEAK